jgi:DNA-binding NarL/FixJ family response regulator
MSDNSLLELDILKSIEKLTKKDIKNPAKTLSPRQIDVLKLIALGKSNKQIAFELNLTEGTVKLHVTAILKLLKVYNRTGAVAEAKNLGLL